FFQASVAVPASALETILSNAKFSNVHEIVVGGSNAVNQKPLATVPPPQAPTTAPEAAPAGDAAEGGAGPAKLDLATLYTMRGLFRGTPRMPVPSSLDSQLYVPAGEAGIAMANLAVRMGMETTGISIPLATPADAAQVRE